MSSKLPQIDRSLIGPPGPGLRNPTLLLFVGALVTFTCSSLAYLLGNVPLVLAAVVNGICLYVFYTVTHEAVHRIAHPSLAVNNWMGRISAALEGFTFPLFRVIHLQHHAYTNHPVRDPDFVIGRKPRWLLPVWTFVRLTHDNVFALRRRLWSGRRRQLAEHLLTVGLQASIITAATLGGHLQAVFYLWIAPLIAAGALLELTVAWLVHFPHESEHPLENTRMFEGKIWQILTLNQSYHLVHHLWARIPWFRYAEAAGIALEEVQKHREQGLVGAGTGGIRSSAEENQEMR